MIEVSFKRKRGGWVGISKRQVALLDLAVRKTALDIEARAKQLAPVDTGALKNSIYTVTAKKDGYSEASAAAKSSDGSVKLFPAIPAPGKLSAIVAVAAEYGLHVEYGTVKSGAQPFMAPAARAARPGFVKACEQALIQGARS